MVRRAVPAVYYARGGCDELAQAVLPRGLLQGSDVRSRTALRRRPGANRGFTSRYEVFRTGRAQAMTRRRGIGFMAAGPPFFRGSAARREASAEK